jgi:hypothetical protein
VAVDAQDATIVELLADQGAGAHVSLSIT